MTKYSRNYRLPSGELTNDPNKYVVAWNKLGNKIIKKFPGYTVLSYDPDVCIICGNDTLVLTKTAINSLLGTKYK